MKSRLSFVLALALLVLFCAPGIRGEVNPYYKPKLALPSLASPQAPVVYTAGGGFTSFGIKLFGGLSFGKIRNSEIEGLDNPDQYKKSLMGFAGGIGFETGGQVGVEVDIMYVQKGLKIDANNFDTGGGTHIFFDADIVINQVSLPVLLRFKFMPGISPYLLLGGSISYILSSTADYKITNGMNTDTGSEDLFDQEGDAIFNRLDYSIVGGAGVELPLGTMRVYFEGRHIYGLADIFNEDVSEPGDWLKLSTTLIMGGICF